MESEGGVYKVPCRVNGLKLKFIFDTGASSVSISSAVAEMMLENDYLSREDIQGSGQSVLADGKIVDHAKINIKTLEIGGIVLKNVEAVVIFNQSAPLLLGQSAIQKMGRISISGSTLIIDDYKNGASALNNSSLTDSERYRYYEEAQRLYEQGSYLLALEKFDVLYHIGYLDKDDLFEYALTLEMAHREQEALDVFLSIEDFYKSVHPNSLDNLYSCIARTSYNVNEYRQCIRYGELCRQYSGLNFEKIYDNALYWISLSYKQLGDYYMAQQKYKEYIKWYLNLMEIEATDCWAKGFRDKFLAENYYRLALFTTTDADYEKYIIISAAWGSSDSIEICKKANVNYENRPRNYVY